MSLSEFQSLLLSQKPGRTKQWHHGTSLHLVQSKGLWVQGDLTNLSGPGPQLPALLALPGGSTSPRRPQGRTPREGDVSQQGVTPLCHSTVLTMSYFTQQRLLSPPITARKELTISPWHQQEEKRENTLSSSLSESSLLLRSNPLASQKSSTVAKPDTILYHPRLKACVWSDLSVRALLIPHPQVIVET